MTTPGLKAPEAYPIQLRPSETAIAVLDLSVRCDDPQQVCAQLMGALGKFLERARAMNVPVPIIFTSSFQEKGKPAGEVATALKRRPNEPLIFPDAFDKFYGGELQPFLESHNVTNLVVVGSSTHVAVLYTATAAARVFRYNVVIPIDGVNTANQIEHDYALHQLQVVPRQASDRIRFSTLDGITFA
jgi:nicotinamidase-related amidase